MKKYEPIFTGFVLVIGLMLATALFTVNAQEKKTVQVDAKSLQEIQQLKEQLGESQKSEDTSKEAAQKALDLLNSTAEKKNYDLRLAEYQRDQATRVAIQQAINARSLKALMDAGVTDPNAEISETPKAEPKPEKAH